MNKIFKQVFTRFIEEFKEEKNKEHFNREVLKPILQEFYNKVYPYVRILFIMYGLNLVLIITILVIILYSRQVK
jgi:hypothetical protein